MAAGATGAIPGDAEDVVVVRRRVNWPVWIAKWLAGLLVALVLVRSEEHTSELQSH
mgnify:CR=1 FL=1